MKGKRIFSKSELDTLKKFVEEKSLATKSNQGSKKYSKSEFKEIEKLMNEIPGQRAKVEFSIYTIFEFIIEVIGWLKIMASPFFIGIVIGSLIYFPAPSNTRLIIASTIVFIGLIVGIIVATRIWKRKGTMYYLSQIMATPDFDNIHEDKKIEDVSEKK
jgi:hypothetical protein